MLNPLIEALITVGVLTAVSILLLVWMLMDLLEKHWMAGIEFLVFLFYSRILLELKHALLPLAPRATYLAMAIGTLVGAIVFIRWIQERRS